MVKTDWKTNDKEGRKLRLAINRIYNRAEQVTDDPIAYANLMRTFGYLISIKGQLSKSEREHELEARIAKLEDAAGLAQKHMATTA